MKQAEQNHTFLAYYRMNAKYELHSRVLKLLLHDRYLKRLKTVFLGSKIQHWCSLLRQPKLTDDV